MTDTPVALERAPAADAAPAGLIPIGVQPRLREYLGTLWRRRDFVMTVAHGQLRAQNQNTVLGNLWHLLNPLMLAGVYYLIFGIIFSARDSMTGGVPYAAFLIVGIFVFTFTNKGMMSGARTVVSNLTLIRSITFPRASLPLASSSAEVLAYGYSVGAMAVLVLLMGTPPRPAWLLLVPAVALQGVFVFGLALVAARLTFHFRDVEQLLPYLLRIWMYLSGVFFPLTFVTDKDPPQAILFLFQAEPMWAFLKINRDALLHGTADATMWAAAAGWAAVSGVAGFVFFYRHESEYGRG